MNFDLSEEQRMLESTLDGLLEKEFSVADVRDFYQSDADLDETLWKALAELGALGLHLPEAHGGAGLELLDLQCVAERLGYHATPGPFLGHALAGLSISLAGSEAQKERWLPRLASGDVVGSVAFAEPGDRWQPEEWCLTPSADGALNGTKRHVVGGRSATCLVVGLSGGELAIVDASEDGVSISSANDLDHTRRVATVEFANARIDRLPDGVACAPRVRDAALVLLAADAVGGAQRCVELSVAYAKQREQFGRLIGSFQALKHQLANIALDAEPCRPLVWYAAYAWDHVPAETPRAAAHAKSHVTDRYLQVARDTVEAHGGIGYTWESEVHYWLKRAVFDRALFGTPRIHRQRAADLAGW
ncbi:MAG: acyl-CoA dehydrogenase family protein [Myxococcota bacterium]